MSKAKAPGLPRASPDAFVRQIETNRPASKAHKPAFIYLDTQQLGCGYFPSVSNSGQSPAIIIIACRKIMGSRAPGSDSG